jgi:hypothetical protein
MPGDLLAAIGGLSAYRCSACLARFYARPESEADLDEAEAPPPEPPQDPPSEPGDEQQDP